MLGAAQAHVLLLNLFLCMNSGSLFAQSSNDSALANTIRIFISSIGDQSPVYNGVQYQRYPAVLHYGQPFFIADSLINGSVTIKGLKYENVPLMLDEVNDELITTDLQGDNLVKLHKHQIEAFSIGRHAFVHHTGNNMKEGYYRLLYNGATQLLAKENKSIQVKPGRTTAETERSVHSSTEYYLKTEKGYQKFHRLNQFLSLFGKDRGRVEDYIRNNKLRTRTNREDLYSQAASFFDTAN
jgi:hypothetical protein